MRRSGKDYVWAIVLLAAWFLVISLIIQTGARAHEGNAVSVEGVSWKDPRVGNLFRIAKCETGYLKGGRPNWKHHNSRYSGGLGFYHGTWSSRKKRVSPVPKARYAAQASIRQQIAVGLVLIEEFNGYSSWPACSIRLGLR